MCLFLFHLGVDLSGSYSSCTAAEPVVPYSSLVSGSSVQCPGPLEFGAAAILARGGGISLWF